MIAVPHQADGRSEGGEREPGEDLRADWDLALRVGNKQPEAQRGLRSGEIENQKVQCVLIWPHHHIMFVFQSDHHRHGPREQVWGATAESGGGRDNHQKSQGEKKFYFPPAEPQQWFSVFGSHSISPNISLTDFFLELLEAKWEIQQKEFADLFLRRQQPWRSTAAFECGDSRDCCSLCGEFEL